MPLIQSKSAAAAASILSRVQQLAGNYNAGAAHLNAIVRDLLALGDDDLAAFCNAYGPEGLNELTRLHAEHGAAINALTAAAAAMLQESGIAWPSPTVDVRPLADKLAAQGRELVFGNGVFVVQRLAEQQPAEA